MTYFLKSKKATYIAVLRVTMAKDLIHLRRPAVPFTYINLANADSIQA